MRLMKLLSRLGMTKTPTITTYFQFLMRLMVGIALLSGTCTWAAPKELSHDEEAFVFAGTCPSGEAYRLVSYKKNIGDLPPSFYNYDGPAGKGTVQSDTAPKVMAVRVCRRLAEIINTNYWE